MRRSALEAAWLCSLALATAAVAQQPPAGEGAPPALAIMERSQQAFYYSPGADMAVKVRMELVNQGGQRKTRVLTMLRRNDPTGSGQRYFMYFHEPGDVRRTALLVWKYPEKEDDRWIFIPAVNLVRRIAASDSRSSFVGSDFSYEDVSGRDLAADAHTLLRQERLGEADCFVVESVPKEARDHTRRLTWVDRSTWLPLKEEHYDAQGELERVFEADRVEPIASATRGAQEAPTPVVTRRTMSNVKSGHRTVVSFESVAFDVGIEEGVFTERALSSPPAKWIR